MKDIKQVILSNKTISEPALTAFISNCFRETGGIKGVTEDLAGIGYGERGKTAYNYLDDAKQTGSLNLESLKSQELKVFCLSVVSTLQDYHDLDTLMVLTFDEAMELIRKI